MTDREVEASFLLEEARCELSGPSPQLKVVFRKCQHACRLLEWASAEGWFTHELRGYSTNETLPVYRHVLGRHIWEPRGSPVDNITWLAEASTLERGANREGDGPTEVSLEVRAGIDWLVDAAEHGYREDAHQTTQARLGDSDSWVPLHLVSLFDAAVFRHVVSYIEQEASAFCSRASVQVRYGAVLTDIWNEHRLAVDVHLRRMGLEKHLSSIDAGLRSPNPESCRMTALECRNVLHDVAQFLWRDPRPTYVHLTANDGKTAMKVSEDCYLNRLTAYLHSKGAATGHRQLVIAEGDRLVTSLHNLHDLQCSGKGQISRAAARSVAIFTYLLLGEMARLTDMEPIERYPEA